MRAIEQINSRRGIQSAKPIAFQLGYKPLPDDLRGEAFSVVMLEDHLVICKRRLTLKSFRIN
jgi:hypothetical protein